MALRRLRAATAAATLIVICAVTPTASTAQAAECQPRTPLTILTVGDSITEGATMAGSVSGGYRAELGRLLDDACVPHWFVVAAAGGTTCQYWNSRMAGLMATHRPDLVLIGCGTNNRLDTASADTVAWFEGVYRTNFDAVMDMSPTALAYPAFVQYSATPTGQCTTPPGPAPSWLRPSEARANDAIYRSIRLIDEWRDRVPDFISYQEIPEGYLDECGVHPTPGGYDVMGRLIYAMLAKRFGWPPVGVPCGLTGRRDGYPVPTVREPCQRMAVN